MNNGEASIERRCILERRRTAYSETTREGRHPDEPGCQEARADRRGGPAEGHARGDFVPCRQALRRTEEEVSQFRTAGSKIAGRPQRGSPGLFFGRSAASPPSSRA